jgi:AcrR family transcriptional regulator
VQITILSSIEYRTVSCFGMPADEQQPKQRSRPTRAQTRVRLLRAASEVFAERGYDRATLDDVAAAAGLTKGAVYSSFAGKDELFYALMAERIGERLALVTEAVDHRSSPEALTSEVGDGLVGLISNQADWHLLFIEFWGRAVRDPSLRQEFALHRRAARAAIARFLEQQAAHVGVDLPAPAEQLAVAVLALSNGIAIEQLADPKTVDPSTFGVILGLLLGESIEGVDFGAPRSSPKQPRPRRRPR